jgi:hypothetical protein
MLIGPISRLATAHQLPDSTSLQSNQFLVNYYAAGITLAPEVIAKALGVFANLCSFQMGGGLSWCAREADALTTSRRQISKQRRSPTLGIKAIG